MKYVKSILLICASLVFIWATATVVLFPRASQAVPGQIISCNNSSSPLGDAQPANASGTALGSLQSVNNTNSAINSMQEKKVVVSVLPSNSTLNNQTANMTTGKGELTGTSKPVNPPSGPGPQNQEPENLVPNPQAFQQAKNEANSPCPPEKLLKSLENKSLVQP